MAPSSDASSTDAPSASALPWPVRWLLLAFAAVCLLLGLIGIVVPGLPTTVFILMAAWAAARSSPSLYRWLWTHRWFGPPLRHWTLSRSVTRRAKWCATVAMAVSAAVLLLTRTHWGVALAAIACMACVLTWLWRRPEP